MIASEEQVPLTKVAFDHPGTRTAWEAARRRIVTRLWLWSGLASLGVIAGIVLAQLVDLGGRRQGSLGTTVIMVSLFAYGLALYACCSALGRLRQARSVLEGYPWRRLTATRRIDGQREASGVLVQFLGSADTGRNAAAIDHGAGPGEGHWSPTMSARNPLRWNRYDPALERGVWFAGDFTISGVLALPGGHGLMTVQRPTRILVEEKGSAKRDHEGVLAAARRGS